MGETPFSPEDGNPAPPQTPPMQPDGSSRIPASALRPIPLKKRKSPWPKILIALVILAIPIGGCSIWLASKAKAPIDEANRFLALIDDGKYDLVSSPGGGCNATPTVVRAAFEGADIDYDLTGVHINNGSAATVDGSIEIPGRSNIRRIQLTLFKFGDSWQMCSFLLS